MTRRTPAHVHPDPEAWIARALGGLDAAAERVLLRHARACAECRELDRAARVLALAVRPGALEPVPAPVRRNAERLFAAHAPVPAARRIARAAASAIGRLRVLVAPAPFGAPALAAVRGGATVSARRCTLGTGAHRVELEWTPEGERWSLRGRVVGDTAGSEAAARFRGSVRSGPRRAPGLTFEFGHGRPRRVAAGPRGFFGPVAATSPEVRVTLRADGRVFRSPWLPAAPRAKRAARD